MGLNREWRFVHFLSMEPAADPALTEKSSGGKVALFIGCGCLTVLALGAGFVALLVFGIFGAMKKSDAYRDTVALVQSHPAAIEAMGEPIEPGFWLTGSINFNNGAGDADLTIPVSGPTGSGEIRVIAAKASGDDPWTYSTRELRIDGRDEAIPLGP